MTGKEILELLSKTDIHTKGDELSEHYTSSGADHKNVLLLYTADSFPFSSNLNVKCINSYKYCINHELAPHRHRKHRHIPSKDHGPLFTSFAMTKKEHTKKRCDYCAARSHTRVSQRAEAHAFPKGSHATAAPLHAESDPKE